PGHLRLLSRGCGAGEQGQDENCGQEQALGLHGPSSGDGGREGLALEAARQVPLGARAHTAYSGSPPSPGERSSSVTSVQAPAASKYARTSVTCWVSSVPSQTATALVGKQRLENDTTKGARGRSTRIISRKSAGGFVTYWMETAHIAASNSPSAKGSRGSRFRSWTIERVNCGFSAISSAFMPSPTTSPNRTPSGRWLRQLL